MNSMRSGLDIVTQTKFKALWSFGERQPSLERILEIHDIFAVIRCVLVEQENGDPVRSSPALRQSFQRVWRFAASRTGLLPYVDLSGPLRDRETV